MATSIALIGDSQVQGENWRDGLAQRWKDQNAGWLQRRLDLKWHSKFEQSKEEFERVLLALTKQNCVETWMLGDMINPESFRGLTDDVNYMASIHLADWLRVIYPTIWKQRRVLTGNHDIGFRHPCATADQCRVTPVAFERFEQTWGPLFQEVTYEGWTLIGFSSDLLLLDGVNVRDCSGNDGDRMLRDMRDAHLEQIRAAIARAERVLLLFHSPEAFRNLMSYHCNPKVRACFVGHLEIPGALKHYPRYQLGEKLVGTPIAHLTKLLFSPPDAVEAVRTHVRHCAEASRQMHLKTVLVPAARHGWVKLLIDSDVATVLHHRADGTVLGVEEIR